MLIEPECEGRKEREGRGAIPLTNKIFPVLMDAEDNEYPCLGCQMNMLSPAFSVKIVTFWTDMVRDRRLIVANFKTTTF